MSTYVIGDIHGCYDIMMRLIESVAPDRDDTLIFLGDYIDRGEQNHEMLKFIGKAPNNYILLRGNHEEEFIAYVDMLMLIDKGYELRTDHDSNEDMASLYETVKYAFRQKGVEGWYFDAYGTIKKLVEEKNVTLSDLCGWAKLMKKMPYYHRFMCNGRECIAVHAGYREDLSGEEAQNFYLYAREEALMGGISGGMIIAGHTPTVLENEYAFNHGNVFRYHDKEKDCIFYDIDCGCVLRKKYEGGGLACLRVDDEKVYLM